MIENWLKLVLIIIGVLYILFWFFSDRCRTTNNMLGDAYGAAVVEALSKNELNAMDEERERERKAEEDEDLESAHAILDKKWKAIKKVTSQKYVK